jgi:ribose transport system substrate-binding protein
VLAGAPVMAQNAIDCAGLKGAAVVHFQGPYTKQLIQGAEAAMAECGGEALSGGPALFDTAQEVANFQDFVLSGANAIVVVAFPSDLWIRVIDDAVKQGVAVSTFDVESPASLASLHTAPKQKDQGRVMADVLADALGDGAEGEVITGICIPGLALIEARVVGFKERLAERLPNVTVTGPLDVKFDQTENFSLWRSVYDANPDALAYIGFCENDLPSLVRIKESVPGATFEIASIGINPDGLKGIADGVALAAIGQKPFLQGYVAMRAMIESIATGDALERGWIDVEPEVVTSDNVAAVTAREASLSDGTGPTRDYYDAEIDAIFEGGVNMHVQSYADLLGD